MHHVMLHTLQLVTRLSDAAAFAVLSLHVCLAQTGMSHFVSYALCTSNTKPQPDLAVHTTAFVTSVSNQN